MTQIVLTYKGAILGSYSSRERANLAKVVFSFCGYRNIVEQEVVLDHIDSDYYKYWQENKK